MFKGTYTHRIDGKGRLPVPAPFRRALAPARAVVVTLLDECLAAYSTIEWQKLEAQLLALPAFSRPANALIRRLMSRAADCALDVQGRILLPPALRSALALPDQAVVVGVLNRFEVWAPAAWASFLEESERLLADVSFDLRFPLAVEGLANQASAAPSRAARPQRKPNR